MVRGRLRVRGPNADVHQRDARVVGALQVIAWHLRQLLGRGAGVFLTRDLNVAGPDEAGVAAVGIGELLAGVFLEHFDVELIIRKQDVVLEMLGRRRGVVIQPG